ncbi:hypothetical protein ORV05_33095 [Amycolatopsis cynarae]|uniref:Uncharacterized protein n=1 Tax=Amycolatopsis cynarae TaxID=2995223 RepID=A0ABY7BF93_9PSEU|nr:hypothetical protein [Amycolatopsis sp. HUAS 11-8]WAL69937.1 hypothetical protein ORV05_33095 [Amycolatopsis sp. HUAS 11-8]
MPTRTDLTRTTRRVLAVGTLAALLTGGLFLGDASASTVLASACTGNVTGNIGDDIAVQGKDVADLVKAGAKEQEIFLHLNAVDPDKLAQEITAKGVLPVGKVPTAASGTVSGDTIAAVVTQALKGADGLGWSWDTATQQKTLASIQNKVAGNCGLSVNTANYSIATGLPSAATGTPAPGTTAPTATAATPSMGTGNATAPRRDYGNIPAAVPGIALSPGDKYPSSAPVAGLPTPEIGVLSGSNTPPGQADVRNTGNANALAAAPTTNTVQLPMLLAVVALAGVSAALVRTWVLRRVS